MPRCSSEALSGGAAAWRWWRRSSGSSSLYSRFRFYPVVVFGSRSPDLIGWIWDVLALVFSAALHLWVWRRVEDLRRGISDNKAVFPSCCLVRLPASGGCTAASLRCDQFPWWEVLGWIQAEDNSSNKLAGSGGSGVGGWRSESPFVACLGDEEDGGSGSLACWRLDLHQGCVAASPGSFITAATASPPFFLAKWWPLPPLSLATVSRSASVGFHLPPGLGAISEALWLVRSRLPPLHPKWCVPGDVEVACVQACFRRAGEGAGPDCFSFFLDEVLTAKFLALCVISLFYVALSVRCNSSVDYE